MRQTGRGKAVQGFKAPEDFSQNKHLACRSQPPHCHLAFSDVLPEIQTKVRKIQLIARNDEGDLPRDQALPIIGREALRDINGTPPGPVLNPSQLLLNRSRCLVCAPRQANQEVAVEQPQLLNLIGVSQIVGKGIGTGPRGQLRFDSERVFEITQKLWS